MCAAVIEADGDPEMAKGEGSDYMFGAHSFVFLFSKMIQQEDRK